jgi:hypothetical protein
MTAAERATLVDLVEERAAIIEHEARTPRARAEVLAARGAGFQTWAAYRAATEASE